MQDRAEPGCAADCLQPALRSGYQQRLILSSGFPRYAVVVLASLWGFGTISANRGGNMLKSVEGVYRDGKIELTEFPGDVRDETRVIVTFLETNHIDLRARGIDEAQAAELRAQLGTFAEEWNSPDMALYDNYDTAKAKL
jgi:hypothetical protein